MGVLLPAAGLFPLSADATVTDQDLASFLCLDLLLLTLFLCACRLLTQPCSLLGSLQGGRLLLRHLYGTCAHQHDVHLERIRGRLRGRLGPELGPANRVLGEMHLGDPEREGGEPELDRELGLDAGLGANGPDL